MVGICVKEYRNGILIAENLRDFQYNVTRCDTFSISLFDYELDSCDNTLVKFINKSQNYHYWTWDFGDLTTLADTSPLFNPVWEYPDTGTYTATLILNAGLSCADTFSLQIPVLPNRVIPAFAHDSVCVGIPIAFTDLTTLIGNVGTISDWNWQFGDGGTSTLQNPVHTYGFQSNYLVSLIITTTSGCVMSATKQITVWPLPNVDAGPDVTIDISGNAPLNNAVSNAVTFLWEPGATLNDPTILNPVASPIVTTDYILTVTSAKGCQKSDTITVLIVIPAEIEVPDAFTPNQDGLNDVFLAYDVLGFEGKGIDEFNFYIFNRWGEVIFESDDITKGWDGTHGRSNKKSEIGTYVWLIKYNTQKDSDIKTLYGNVSLIR